eukprot:4454448-Prymnesium_polylepis.1
MRRSPCPAPPCRTTIDTHRLSSRARRQKTAAACDHGLWRLKFKWQPSFSAPTRCNARARPGGSIVHAAHAEGGLRLATQARAGRVTYSGEKSTSTQRWT